MKIDIYNLDKFITSLNNSRRRLLIFLFKLTFFPVFCIVTSSCSMWEDDKLYSNNMPEGAIWAKQTLMNLSTPSDFKGVVGWLQAATIKNEFSLDSGIIYIDYMKLIEVTNNIEKIVFFEDYNLDTPRPLNQNEGGLYNRVPKWFDDSTYTLITNSIIENGELKIVVSETPNNIVKWWTKSIKTLPNSRYFLEVKVKITGQIGLQLGSDFLRELDSPFYGYIRNCSTSNNCVAWVSDWLGDTKNDYRIIKVPWESN